MIDSQTHGEESEERHQCRPRYGGAIFAPSFHNDYYVHVIWISKLPVTSHQ